MGIELFDMNEALKPYRSGGTKDNPVRRTLETISGKLIIANRIPPEIVGSAIFKTFYDLQHNGLKFEGNGTYGSAGRDLYTHIKNQCIEMGRRGAAEDVTHKMMDLTACAELSCRLRKRTVIKLEGWKRVKRFLVWPRIGFLGSATTFIIITCLYLLGLYSEELTIIFSGG